MTRTTERLTEEPVSSAEERLAVRAIAIARLQTQELAIPLDGGGGGFGDYDELIERSIVSDDARNQSIGGTVIQVHGVSYAGEADVTTVFRPDQSEAMKAFINRPA